MMHNPHKRAQLTAFEQVALEIAKSILSSAPTDAQGTFINEDRIARQAACIAERMFHWASVSEELP